MSAINVTQVQVLVRLPRVSRGSPAPDAAIRRRWRSSARRTRRPGIPTGPRRANARETNIVWAHHDDPSLTLAPAPPRPPAEHRTTPSSSWTPCSSRFSTSACRTSRTVRAPPPLAALPDRRTTEGVASREQSRFW